MRVNQLLLFWSFIASCLLAISCSTNSLLAAMLQNGVKVFFSICVVIGMAPSSEYTAMVGQRSVSPWICLSSRLSKESSSCSSPLVRVTASNPQMMRGLQKVVYILRHLWIYAIFTMQSSAQQCVQGSSASLDSASYVVFYHQPVLLVRCAWLTVLLQSPVYLVSMSVFAYFFLH